MDAFDQVVADIKFDVEGSDDASYTVLALTRVIIRLAIYLPADYVVGAALSAAATLAMGRPLDPKEDNDVRLALKSLLELFVSKRNVLRSDATNSQPPPDRVM